MTARCHRLQAVQVDLQVPPLYWRSLGMDDLPEDLLDQVSH